MAAYNAAVDQAMGWTNPNYGVARSVGEAVVAAGLGPPAEGYSYGYSPVGMGVSQVHNSAPESVQIAATGPGVFGAFADQFGQPMTGVGSFFSGLGWTGIGGLFGGGGNGGFSEQEALAGNSWDGSSWGGGWGDYGPAGPDGPGVENDRDSASL
jgi:hypothetical protein